MAKAATTKKLNIFQRILKYIGDVRAEMRRVVWPVRSEVLNSSIVVIVTLAFFIFFTLVTDWLSVSIVSLIGKIGG